MAEASEQEATEATKGGKTWLVVLIAVVLSLGAGGGGVWFMLGSADASAGQTEEEAAKAAEPVDPAADFRERVYSLEPFVVNVTGEGYPRYLKLKVELETDSPAAKDEIDARLAQVRDTIILLLSSKRLADINDFEGKALLKDDLRERLNGIVSSGSVESVLFTEFVVQ